MYIASYVSIIISQKLYNGSYYLISCAYEEYAGFSSYSSTTYHTIAIGIGSKGRDAKAPPLSNKHILAPDSLTYYVAF